MTLSATTHRAPVLSTCMGDATSGPSDARAQRRWLIGIGITVVFGIFGAVMAVLAYSNAKSTPASHDEPAGTSAPAPAVAPTPTAPQPRDERGRGKGHRK